MFCTSRSLVIATALAVGAAVGADVAVGAVVDVGAAALVGSGVGVLVAFADEVTSDVAGCWV